MQSGPWAGGAGWTTISAMAAVPQSLPTPSLSVDPSALRAFCRHRGIQRLSLFGSRLKGEHGPESDVDLLVEFVPGTTPTLLDMADMERELGALLGGLRVDLRTPSDLSRYFRDDVLRKASVQYEAG